MEREKAKMEKKHEVYKDKEDYKVKTTIIINEAISLELLDNGIKSIKQNLESLKQNKKQLEEDLERTELLKKQLESVMDSGKAAA